MNILQTLSETTLAELFLDKSSKIYFHGASNDNGEDPDNRRISPPSPDHPFYVTADIQTAIEYSDFTTGDDGRITDEIDFTKDTNPRVYLLRLKNDRKYFDFKERKDLRQLKEVLISENAIDSFWHFFKDQYKTVSVAADRINEIFRNLNHLLTDIYHNGSLKKNINKELEKYANSHGIRIGSNEFHPICVAFNLLMIINPTDEIFQSEGNTSRHYERPRRFIKAKLFDLVRKHGYLMVREEDTLNFNPNVFELAILDKSMIKDISPVPLKIDQIKQFKKLLIDKNL